jgi:hypothetical protein
MLSMAEERGLPVQLPLLDLEDQARLTPADLWRDYGPAVRQASERYGQPLILTGRLRQVAADLWVSRWTLYEDGDSQGIEAKAEDAAGAIRLAIDQVTELLASRYAPASGHDGEATVRLQITGVNGLQDYVRVLKLVGEREVVEQVAVRSVDGASLVLAVKARGGREALAQVLDLVRGLNREPAPAVPHETLPVFEPLPPPGTQPAESTAPTQGALVPGPVDVQLTAPSPQPSLADQPAVQPIVQPMVQPVEARLPDLIYSLNP